jgi:hypothetical protein
MSSDASSCSGTALSRCITKMPELSTMSWVLLYLVRLTVARGSSGTMLIEPADRLIRPLANPPSIVVTATGNGRRPPRTLFAASTSIVMSLFPFGMSGALRACGQ